jgi:hypothetical protein
MFRSFQPLLNPIGFGASDFIELALAAFLLLATLALRPWIEPLIRKIAPRTSWCMLSLAALPVILRLALLPHHPVPAPDLYDEFGHLLVADTLRHFRLANPSHPFHPFFETFFVLQQPTYSSIYPLGQGIAMAIGWMLFGLPWAGVVLFTAAFCSLCYWMLRAWTTPEWALLGGLLAVIEFGPLSQWMNSYWGGAFAGTAGCLVFGSLPRLRATGRMRDGILLGLGLAMHWLTRPYESIFLFISVLLYFVPMLGKRPEWIELVRGAAAAGVVVLGAAALTLLHDKRVTGDWMTVPEILSQYQYGVPAALTFRPNVAPHRELTPEQNMQYKAQLSFRGPGPETVRAFVERLAYRIRFYRFFFLVPLYLSIPAFVASMREFRFLWVAITLVLFALGVNFFPAFQFHYVAACTCLFILVAVTGLRVMSEWRHPAGAEAGTVIILLCAAHFLFWYGMHLFDDTAVSTAMRRYETWNSINHSNPERRILIKWKLAQLSGKHLVFVRYWPQHVFQDEWVYNDADIDSSRVVWARDRGNAENEKLQHYYPDRAVWLLEPDASPLKLSRYEPEPPSPPPPTRPQPLRLEQVR